MKNFTKLMIIASLLCVGIFSACEKFIYINGYIPDPKMSIYPSSLNVTAEGDSAINIEITINTYIEGAKVTAVNCSDWFTIKDINNKRAIVMVAPNPADTMRYADIKFSYNKVECLCLTVAQEGRND